QAALKIEMFASRSRTTISIEATSTIAAVVSASSSAVGLLLGDRSKDIRPSLGAGTDRPERIKCGRSRGLTFHRGLRVASDLARPVHLRSLVKPFPHLYRVEIFAPIEGAVVVRS